jgi:hypothetical protein
MGKSATRRSADPGAAGRSLSGKSSPWLSSVRSRLVADATRRFGPSATREARILRSLPDQDDGANQRGTLNGQPDKSPVLSGTETSNGQAAMSTQNGQ